MNRVTENQPNSRNATLSDLAAMKHKGQSIEERVKAWREKNIISPASVVSTKRKGQDINNQYRDDDFYRLTEALNLARIESVHICATLEAVEKEKIVKRTDVLIKSIGSDPEALTLETIKKAIIEANEIEALYFESTLRHGGTYGSNQGDFSAVVNAFKTMLNYI